MRIAPLLSLGLVLLQPTFAATFDWSADPLPKVKIETVAFRGWVPDTEKPLAGTLVLIPGRHGDGRGLADQPRWQQLAGDLGFAIIGCQFANGEPYDYQNDGTGEVARAINAAVEKLAEVSGKPELAKAPLAFWGTSAGSNVSMAYCTHFPERVAAVGSSKGTGGPQGATGPKQMEIPMIFAVGGKDKPEWVTGSVENIGRGLGKAPWTLALQANEGHGVDASLDVIIPFLRSAVEQRLGKKPATGSSSFFKSELPNIGSGSRPASAKTTFAKINLRDGWLGDRETFEVATYSDFKGTKAKAIWLPDEATALAWQAYLRR
ncbi:MAG: hypothetical protein SFU53_13295 [Terrimicrobiaceae bacterium]|nr:hypothetical protein [Terrimicrobiaceae bacterium]